MVPAGNKAKRLSSVNHATKKFIIIIIIIIIVCLLLIHLVRYQYTNLVFLQTKFNLLAHNVEICLAIFINMHEMVDMYLPFVKADSVSWSVSSCFGHY